MIWYLSHLPSHFFQPEKSINNLSWPNIIKWAFSNLQHKHKHTYFTHMIIYMIYLLLELIYLIKSLKNKHIINFFFQVFAQQYPSSLSLLPHNIPIEAPTAAISRITDDILSTSLLLWNNLNISNSRKIDQKSNQSKKYLRWQH